MFGVDVSSWKPISDIQAVKDAGNDFLITKCTGGLTYKNPLYQEQVTQARSVGMLVGHYHFLHETDMDTSADTLSAGVQVKYKTEARMQAEADWFLANVDIRPGEIVCLDVEDKRIEGNLTPCVAMWCGYVSAKLGFLPFIYTYPFYIKERNLSSALARYPLWYAEYNEPMQNSPAPWDRITLRQFTASAFVPGIGVNVDRNSFEGAAADWRKLGMPDPNTPPATANVSPVVTEGRNWGAGSKGRIVHHAETVMVINDEDYDPPKTFLAYAIDGQQFPFVELK